MVEVALGMVSLVCYKESEDYRQRNRKEHEIYTKERETIKTLKDIWTNILVAKTPPYLSLV